MWGLLKWLLRRLGPAPASLSVDDEGFTFNDFGRSPERVVWDDLTEVCVVTTDRGPFVEDVFFVLATENGKTLRIPQPIVELHFLEILQRLPGFDNMQFIEAMACMDNRRFVCWRKEH
jgi:hypothetical protein